MKNALLSLSTSRKVFKKAYYDNDTNVGNRVAREMSGMVNAKIVYMFAVEDSPTSCLSGYV